MGMKKASPSQGHSNSVSRIWEKVKLVIAGVMMLIGVMAIVVMPVVNAGAISEAQAGRISMNCGSIRIQLGALQKTDSRMRVYLGSKYEIILSNFVINLNLRLVRNNLATEDLTGLQTTFSNERERFKSDFTSYARSLEDLLDVDCQKEPVQFYEKLEEVRVWREDVQASYNRMNEVLEWHRAAVVGLKESL
jgi:hypothetical protein